MQLSDPVTKIPLIGATYAEKLKKLNIETAEDLLYHFPFRYADYSKIIPIAQSRVGETVTIQGEVWEIKNIYTKYRKRLTLTLINDGTSSIQAIWFNQPFIVRSIKKGDSVSLSGKIDWFNKRPTLISPEYEKINREAVNGKRLTASGGQREKPPITDYRLLAPRDFFEMPITVIHTGRLVPIYPETEGISSKWLRSRIFATLSILIPKTPNPKTPSDKTFHNNERRGLTAVNKKRQFQHFESTTVSEKCQFEFLPEIIRKNYELANLCESLWQIHFPKNWIEVKNARKRLGFDEMFLLQLKALKRRDQWDKKTPAFQLKIKNEKLKIKNFVDNLPFKLTEAQKRVAREILQDLQKTQPANRLLQGDVGCGKTVVATITMYTAHLCGFQSALMAPTEVLAEQHYKTVSELLEPFGVRVGLFTSAQKGAKLPQKEGIATFTSRPFDKLRVNKRRLPSASLGARKPAIPNEGVDVLIGTHALIFEKVRFENLGLVIIDEQHRFGVRQRAKLVKKAGGIPHVLTMTATPIPRSVALTVFADQDLSIIDEMPPGRIPVKTWVVPPEKRGAAYEWIRKQVVGGRWSVVGKEEKKPKTENLPRRQAGRKPKTENQAFIICPLIEESEYETLKSVKAVTTEFERLKDQVFPDFRLGLLHGRLKSDGKNEALTKFRKGELDILVATPVVEVGIDVPQASIMVIEGAERFGLASLHQLRGRVGRGGQQAYCLLFASTRDATAIKRLKAMEKLNDGLKLAELDLTLRGPGEIFGIKQHGFIDLKIAKMTDLELIEKTRRAAGEILPEISKYPKLCGKIA